MSDFLNISGIGEKKAKLLAKIGLNSLNDALLFFPRTFEDKTVFVTTNTFENGEKACIPLTISSVSRPAMIRKGLTLSTVHAFDDDNFVEITFFNQNYVSNALEVGKTYTFFGVIKTDGRKIVMNSPKYEVFKSKKGRLLPVYKLTSGLHQADVRKITFNALKSYNYDDTLPENLQKKYKLVPINTAIFNMHYPSNHEQLKQAQRRIEFEKLFMYLLKIKTISASRKQIPSYKVTKVNYNKILEKIPFSLTDAQKKCLDECIFDLQSGFQLNRLLQGDVGSGKTIVAIILSYILASEGKQIAFIVPTEILANQHFHDIDPLFTELGLKSALLTGSTRAKAKREIKEGIKTGEINIVIGTHAVFTDDVEFSDLSLVIVDEQHRFGVNQRASLLAKGENPHTLVMSATPIPRTMSLILYGDLDISVIDEMPKDRQPIDTFLCDETKRKRVFSFISKQILNSNQVYIVCPLVEESDFEGIAHVKDVTQYYDAIKKVFPDVSIGLIHGKIKPKEKDEIMEKFVSNEIQILVSTTVIEVGVNVPNATLMIIENAERFGLSTLHQLRGRVGRGKDKSYCILMSDTKSKRLEALTKMRNGFDIAREDLSLRGAGDYIGVRQSGDSTLSMLNLDVKMLECASNEVNLLLKDENFPQNHPKLYKKINDEMDNGVINIFN